MIGFTLALLSTSALAYQTSMVDNNAVDAYDPTIVESTIEQKFRFGPITTTKLIDTTTVKWSVETQTNVNEDTGDQNLRITHKLEANIFATDTVTFELSFVPETKWDNVDDSDYAAGLGEDAGRCDLSINSSDPQFWDVTLTDIYYKCNGEPEVTAGTGQPTGTKCYDADNNYNSNSVLSESSSNN